jgi:hypothetical protein
MDLSNYENKVYSQNGEDGVIEQIFKTIGVTNKYYVEFGVEDGKECNTRYLREKSWSGLMMDGGYKNKRINLQKEFITADNITKLFKKYNVPKSPDLVSIDLDYNDFYICNEVLKKYTPRLLILEYNGSILPKYDKVVVYDPDYMWIYDKSNYTGCSIKTYCKLLNEYGYTIIYCDNMGVNLFAVQSEEKKFKDAGCINKLFKPANYRIGNHKYKGHKPDWYNRQYLSYKTECKLKYKTINNIKKKLKDNAVKYKDTISKIKSAIYIKKWDEYDNLKKVFTKTLLADVEDSKVSKKILKTICQNYIIVSTKS